LSTILPMALAGFILPSIVDNSPEVPLWETAVYFRPNLSSSSFPEFPSEIHEHPLGRR